MIFKKAAYVIVFLASTLLLKAQTDLFEVKLLDLKELNQILPFVIKLRLTYFREYPYLYEGTIDEENAYLEWFSKQPHSALVVAYLKDEPVGFVTGTAFTDYDQHFKGSIELFEGAGLKPSSYYYISEIIVLPEHRGKGLGRRLFSVIEEHAKSLHYTASCFVTESHDTHPLKPENYRSLTPLWHKLGYVKASIFTTFSWPTIQRDQTVINQSHRLDYWLKDFKKLKVEL